MMNDNATFNLSSNDRQAMVSAVWGDTEVWQDPEAITHMGKPITELSREELEEAMAQCNFQRRVLQCRIAKAEEVMN